MPKRLARHGWWLVLAGAAAPRPGCSRLTRGSQPALIALPGAADVKHDASGGAPTVSYRLQEEYPARAALGEIRSRLAAQGWQPLKEDYLGRANAVCPQGL